MRVGYGAKAVSLLSKVTKVASLEYASIKCPLNPANNRGEPFSISEGSEPRNRCNGSAVIDINREAAASGLFASGKMSGFDDNRMKPSCVIAHVAHASWPLYSVPCNRQQYVHIEQK